MPFPKGKKYKNYLNNYEHLLQYDLDANYPYKELGDKLNIHQNAVREMLKWIQEKPEVIAYLRVMYSPEALPNWVGVIKGATLDDYRAIVKREGLPPPLLEEEEPTPTTTGPNPKTIDDDVAKGTIPPDGGAIEATNLEVGRGGSDPILVEGNRGGVAEGQGGVGPSEGEDKKSPLRQRKELLPPLLKEVKPKVLPVEIKRKPQFTKRGMGGSGVLEEMNIAEAKKVVKKRLTRAQHHDPNVVQLPGGGWGTVVQTQGGGYAIKPAEAPVVEADEQLVKKPVSEAKKVLEERLSGAQEHDPSVALLPGGGMVRVTPKPRGGYTIEPVEENLIETDDVFESVVNEVTREEIKVNTLAFVKKVALTPSLVMGHAYLSSKKDEKGVPLFIGDVGDFINYCVRYTLKFGFGVEFAIVSGKPTLNDFLERNQNA